VNRSDVLHLMFMSGAIGFIVGMNVPLLIQFALDWWDARRKRGPTRPRTGVPPDEVPE